MYHKRAIVWILYGLLSGCSGSDNQPIQSSPTPNVQPPAPALLTVNKSGSGTVTSNPPGINCGTGCSADFESGASVTLGANGTAGSTFSGWSGACSGTGGCVVVMNGAQTVSATFTPPPSTANLTVTSAGTGTGNVSSSPGGISNCAASCTASFSLGTTVTLTATPTNGALFAGWTGGGCSGTGTCVVPVNANQTVTASFTTPLPITDLTVFGASQGLTGNVIDAGPDDAQNIWAVTPDALYLLQPGQTTFTRFTAADGLNITPFTDPNGQPTVSSITAVAGGRPGEVFVGYYGFEGVIPPPAPPSCCVPNADFSDPRWSVGQADKVTLNPNGTLQVRHYNFICDISFNCWEERSVRRMTFAHQGTAAGHLFIGFDHGVTHLFNDVFGDHIHVITLYHFTDGSRVVQKQGEQYGLFVAPNGDLLTGGAYGVGLQRWNPDPRAWVNESFVYAFTTYGPATSYNQGPNALDVPAGYREDQRGVALTPDGVAWMASLTHGLASFNGASIRPYTNVPGLPSSGLRDMTADPDGTLWIVDGSGRLLRFNPADQSVRIWPGISNARRIVIDTTVVPRALYVSMGSSGLAVVRGN